ncbi:hypothetical protein KIN20_018066 [Parelaphostrongylus tenuis]|uniref:Uncharacterized protein n=1 Tax=Parelaphostrongylus tenuis TaxID=148309 RepID=A0AAD5N0M9_PARTN|nr:hypothetical protein KIN20_018066 [Parelaphostrongylus tenuis]
MNAEKDEVTISPVNSALLDNCRNSFDYKHHHVELVKGDVAKCSEQGSSIAGIGSILALLLGICHRRRKLN